MKRMKQERKGRKERRQIITEMKQREKERRNKGKRKGVGNIKE